MVWLYWVIVGGGLGLLIRFVVSGSQSLSAIGSIAMGAVGAIVGGLLGRHFVNIGPSEIMGIEAIAAAGIGSFTVVTVYGIMNR